nr:T9SS type A sorting domain-containing protein [Bacteroidota bacterium]
ACNEENPSNAFENGRGCSVNNNWTAANDITVATGFDAMLSSIVPNIFMSVGATATTVDVTIFEDAGGLPGTMIDQQLAVVPTSQVVVGSNFGLDISAVTLDLTPVALAGDAAMDVPYWVAIQVTTSDGANAFWEDTTATSIGADLAFNDGTGWIIPGPGQDGVYTYVADCTDIGSAPVACDESNPSNAFENGRGCSANNNWTAANDITVATGFDAMLSSIVPNIFMSVGATATTVDVTIFDDAAGLPGTMIDQQLGLVPTSQVVVGSNFGLDISEVTIDLTPVALAGDAGADTPYWVAIQVVTSDGANAFWEDSTASANGADLAFNDGTGWIIPGPGQDGVYTFVAECTEIGGGGGDFCTAGTYDDRAAFDAELALGTAFLEDFGGGPAAIQGCDGPISAAGNSCFPAGEILDGIVITSSTPDETDPMVFAPAGFSVNVDDVVGTNQFTSYTIINFPDNDMNAFGFDLHSLVSGSPVDLRIFGASGLIETVTVDVTSQGPVFFGYIAEEIITSVEMEDLSGANVELIAQFAFGNCSTGPVLTEDECGGAIPVACDDVVVGDTSDNTDTGGNSAAPDEWYSFTGTGSPQVVTVSLCDGGTGYDSRLTVYDACDGNEVATNDDSCGLQSELSFFSDGTSTYYIAVEGFGAGDVGAFSMAITCVDPPVNDMCDGALAIACGDTLAGTTLNATDDTGAAPDCDTTTSAPGVWYVYEDTSGFPSDILVSTCSANTDYDTKISVYTGDCGAPPLTCVAGNDDSANCTDFQSEVEFQSDGNTTFYILVHGFNGDQGDFDITMTCTIVPPPNDEIANAIDLDEVGCPFTDTDVVMPGATTEDGNPTDCNIDGANGVWYKLTPTGDGFIRGTVGTPAGVTSVTFYTAPNESSTEDELVLVDWFENQCFPNVTARIPAVAGQSYYCFVVNSGGVTDIIFDECETLGVEELEAYGFSFYPNPADEVINLSSAELIESVEVYSILGQRVLVQDINATTSQINISALSQGAYLMQVSINGQVGTYKILKK